MEIKYVVLMFSLFCLLLSAYYDETFVGDVFQFAAFAGFVFTAGLFGIGL